MYLDNDFLNIICEIIAPAAFNIISSTLNIPTFKNNCNSSLLIEMVRQINIKFLIFLVFGNRIGKNKPNGINSIISKIK